MIPSRRRFILPSTAVCRKQAYLWRTWVRAKVAFLPPEHVLLASPADSVGGGGRCASFQAPQDRVAASIRTLRRTTLPLLPSGSMRPERHTPKPKEIRLQAKRPPSPHRGRQEFLRCRHRVRLVPRGAPAAASLSPAALLGEASVAPDAGPPPPQRDALRVVAVKGTAAHLPRCIFLTPPFPFFPPE